MERNTPKGHLSPVSKRKLRQAISTLDVVADYKKSFNPKYKTFYQWKLNFITLTLPTAQKISDSEFKRNYLNHFIVEFVRNYKPIGYVYRLEPQQNGNIHAHFITDRYIQAATLRNLWNRILSKGHFIDEFEAKNGHRNPNSTDVHSLQKVRNVSAYLTEYLSKKCEGRRLIEGKLWGCSDNLLEAMKGEFTQEMNDALTQGCKDNFVTHYRPEKHPYIEFFFFKMNRIPPEFFYLWEPRYRDWLTRVLRPPDISKLENQSP